MECSLGIHLLACLQRPLPIGINGHGTVKHGNMHILDAVQHRIGHDLGFVTGAQVKHKTYRGILHLTPPLGRQPVQGLGPIQKTGPDLSASGPDAAKIAEIVQSVNMPHSFHPSCTFLAFPTYAPAPFGRAGPAGPTQASFPPFIAPQVRIPVGPTQWIRDSKTQRINNNRTAQNVLVCNCGTTDFLRDPIKL